MSQAALLIGNGLNRCYEEQNPGISWRDLLRDLADHYGVEFVEQNSFPLEFECLVNAICEKAQKAGEPIFSKELIDREKKSIAKKAVDLQPVADSLHHRFVNLPVDHILTTNYDYVLERAWDPKADAAAGSEKKYSLKRKAEINGKNFYHIHGEAKKPDSMCLGFKHYIRAAGKMSDLVRDKKFDDKLAEGRPLNSGSWLDLMFTHDIHIVGLALDTCEIDLWWLLTYRAYVLHSNPEIRSHISNTITLYDTSPLDSKKSVFERLQVTYVPMVAANGDFVSAYEKIASEIAKKLS